MIVNYQILFSIEVLNGYFNHGKWNAVTFIPSHETLQLIKEKSYRIKQVGNQLLVICRINTSDNKPFTLPDVYDKFSFILQPESPNYINFTNIPLQSVGLKCYHFNNLHNNSLGGVNYLTSKIGSYQNTTAYNPGDFVLGADSKIYESIKINNGAQVPDNSNASKNFWVQHGDAQFVSNTDTQEIEGSHVHPADCVSDLFTFKTSVKRAVHEVKIYALNPVTTNYDKLSLQYTVKFDEPHDLVQIDMHTLPSGKYRVKVMEDIRYVYRSTMGVDGIPMFIDVFNLPKSEPHTFLNADDTLKHIKYTIRFGSRRVYWRYKTRTNAIDKIEDTSGNYTFVSDGLRYFISERPMPLSDAPMKTLTANTGTLVITSPLPNPRADRLLNKRDEVFTTESFINF